MRNLSLKSAFGSSGVALDSTMTLSQEQPEQKENTSLETTVRLLNETINGSKITETLRQPGLNCPVQFLMLEAIGSG